MTDIAATPSSLARSSLLKWSSTELLARESWRRELPADVADEFFGFLLANPQVTVETFAWRPERLPLLAAFGARTRARLQHGDGVQCLHGIADLDLEPEHARCLYLAIGCALGDPMLQYGRMYPVVDRGKSYTEETIPVSMTNAETRFHTDSSSVGVVPDFVGLLCEQPSDHGGDSLVSNAIAAFDAMQREAPELLERLRRPLIRDVVTPGRERSLDSLLQNRFPVFDGDGPDGELLFRYMRYWIETGQERAGQPLDDVDMAALDKLDELLERPEHVVRFRLERGEILWVNNRVMAHNRTAFRDTPGNTRCLQRMWVQARAQD